MKKTDSTTKTRASRRTAPLCSALPGQNKNPLFIEFYPHTKCDCYKINLPWTKYRCHTLVLCDAAKGLAHAKRLARRAIAEHLDHAMAEPMPNVRGDSLPPQEKTNGQ
jgi:hypothetical protein